MKVGDSFKFVLTDSTYTVHNFVRGVYPDDWAVLFTNQEMVSLNTLENSGLFTPLNDPSVLKLQLLRDIQELPIKDKLYWTTQIQNCKDLNLAQSLIEGLKKQLTTETKQPIVKRTWVDSDLVPNPK